MTIAIMKQADAIINPENFVQSSWLDSTREEHNNVKNFSKLLQSAHKASAKALKTNKRYDHSNAAEAHKKVADAYSQQPDSGLSSVKDLESSHRIQQGWHLAKAGY